MDQVIEILAQPNDETCGPTCLHAVYGFHGVDVGLDDVIGEVTTLANGGTLGVFLANHALQRGFDATLYTVNLDLFDPTWFNRGGIDLSRKLKARAAARGDARTATAVDAYLRFLDLGGSVRFEEFGPGLIRRLVRSGAPVMTGLSATYLYECAREEYVDGALRYNDIAGEPTGHFVVVHGYDPTADTVLVADPLHENPWGSHNYRVGMNRLLGAILLGVLTYDGNLVVLTKRAAR